MKPDRAIVIVADSHISLADSEKVEEFFAMLERLRTLPYGVVFLGDIFELWIALDGYEDSTHKRFLLWCAEERKRRIVGFLEGNHEYFAASGRTEHFTWAVEDAKLLEGGTLLAHGDLINTRDLKYRFMRLLFKSWLAKLLLKAFASFLGPLIAERIRLGLKSSNLKHKKSLPHNELETYTARCVAEGASQIVVGHFHEGWRHLSKSGAELHIVPEWRDEELVGLLEPSTGKLECLNWHELR